MKIWAYSRRYASVTPFEPRGYAVTDLCTGERWVTERTPDGWVARRRGLATNPTRTRDESSWAMAAYLAPKGADR